MARGSRLTRAPLAVALALSAPDLGAQSPTTVAVEARLAADQFRVAFAPAPRLAKVEAAAAKQFATYLSEKVGYLRFAVADSTLSYRLIFELDRRERGSPTEFDEFGFWVRVQGPPNAPAPKYWLPVRSADQAIFGIGTEEQFLTSLAGKLSHQDPGLLRDSLLPTVPITDEALANPSPPGWALRLRHLDLCLLNSSQLEFINEIQVGAMMMERKLRAEVVARFQVPPPPAPTVLPFLEGVFSLPSNAADSALLAQALSQGPVRVKGVFVASYQHDALACRNRGSGSGEGGAP